MSNEHLLEAAERMGMTEIGGHPVKSQEASDFLDAHPEARETLKHALHGASYSASGKTIWEILGGQQPRLHNEQK